MVGFLILAAAQLTSRPSLPTEEEVVVTGRRMSQVSYAMKVHRKTRALQCWITKTSGDPTIDWQICEIAKVCATIKPLKKKLLQECMGTKKREFMETYVSAGKRS